MAKISISIEIDTDESTMDVTVNGQKIDNATSVSCYLYRNMYENENEISCNVSATETDEESGIVKSTTYYANASEEGRRIDRAKADHLVPGFVGVASIDPQTDINKFIAFKSRFGKSGV